MQCSFSVVEHLRLMPVVVIEVDVSGLEVVLEASFVAWEVVLEVSKFEDRDSLTTVPLVVVHCSRVANDGAAPS